jgi:small subunit ribosomal protein S3
MRQQLEKLIGKKLRLNIQEIRQPELDAYLVARSVAEQIERRVAYRRAMKQAIFRTIQSGAKGIKVSAAGRLANAEIARRQTLAQGQVPLHTLRADIDYGFTEAHTTLGRIGVKVWIYKGQVLPEMKTAEAEAKPAEAAAEPAVSLGEKPIEAAIKAATAVAEEKPSKEDKPVKAEMAAEVKEKPSKEDKPIKAKAPAEVEPEEKAGKPKAKKVVKPAEEKKPVAKATAPKKPKKAAETGDSETKAVKKTKNVAKTKEEE